MFGTPNDQLLANQVMSDLAKREKLYSRFNANKRYGIMRGDWMFHLYADPTVEPGSKISVFGVDPASVFPIYMENNVDVIIGYDIVDLFLDNEGNTKLKRLRYFKQTEKAGPSPITVEELIFELDAWGGPGMAEDEAKPINVPGVELLAPQTLPAPIDHLPIYHIPNFSEPGVIWGSSEMRGLERIMAAINQGISDEELALALDGLGVYTTDAGTPVNENEEDIGWNLGPGRVVELPDGKTMSRLTGISSVAPSQEHLAYLHSVLDESIGIPGIAKGRPDVTVAESGIALLLELGPLLARVEEKEQIVTDVVTNMLYDLSKWYVAYEGGAFRSLLEVTRWMPKYGPKIPENQQQAFDNTLTLAAAVPQIVPMSYIRDRLRKNGFEDMPDEAAIDSAMNAEADATGARVDQEVNAELAANGGAPVVEG